MPFPATITITIAAATNRVLQRVNQDNYGSEYQYSDANESCKMLFRHSTDSVDGDLVTMKRHNVYFERVVYPTPVAAMKKFSTTLTLRHGKYDDPSAAATQADGICDWAILTTNLADLANGMN